MSALHDPNEWSNGLGRLWMPGGGGGWTLHWKPK